ncbi:water channel [Rhodotorula toruloides]|uniref:Water channel n=1 Tax=Rhodotorula toruloides TaxID=5286 RepID=A0A511K965_RHOTO|nr:water channel [Rhodotorula toruloides]
MPREGETAPALDPHRSRLNWHIRKPTFGPKRLAVKNHFIAICGEMVGMTLFMIFSLGGNDRRRHGGHKCHGPYAPWTGWIDGDNAQHVEPRVAALLVRFDAADFLSSPVLYIAFSFGISLNVIAWCFYRVTGGPFNPAITLGMLLVGALSPLRAALLVVSQILGGITGAAIIQALLPNTLNVRTTLGGGVSVARGLFIENVRFAYPSFRWLAASISLMRTATSTVYSSLPRNRGNFIAPLPIGLSLFASELVSVYWTGGSLNKFLEYETLLGPEPSEDCHDPVLQLSSWTEGVSAGEGVDPNEGYMIEGKCIHRRPECHY